MNTFYQKVTLYFFTFSQAYFLFNHVFSRQTFATLQDLVTGYQSAACKGLCCQLTKPCQKPQPREGRSNALEYATRDQYEIPRSQITLTKKLGEIFFYYNKSRKGSSDPSSGLRGAA